MAEDKTKEKEVLSMADRRKKIRKIYDNESSVRTYIRQNNSASRSAYTEASFERLLTSVGSSSFNEDDLQKFASYAYATEPNYANIIDYLVNMYLWRYYFVPKKVKENTSQDYKTTYDLISSVIDGINIEVIYPLIIKKVLKEGIAYVYTEKDTPSKTISTILLDPDYCAPVMMTQYGTGIYRFDLTYFDDLGASVEELDIILDYYPKELAEGYRAWKSNRDADEFLILNGKYSTFIRQNDLNFPNKLTTVKSLLDYDKYRNNELERNTSKLDKIISHKIPSYQDTLLFEVEEVEELHKSMSRMLSNNKRTKLMTTFGDLDVLTLGESDKIQNEVLEKAHEAIYDQSGLNSELFNGSSAESIKFGIQKDQSIIWNLVEQITNFYNLTINNLYNFKGYQVELNLLPMTHYNASDLMERYRKNAEYGIGKLELIVGSGTKQTQLQDKLELEDYLGLNKLKPLNSSHTQSGSNDSEAEQPKEEEEEEKTSVEEDIQDEGE